MAPRAPASSPPWTLGWREWVSLPEWQVPAVKAKVDTGARTSSLHAFDLETTTRAGQDWVRFVIHPWQRSTSDEITVEVPVLEHRQVRSSSGAAELRPVVLAVMGVLDRRFEFEVTLTRRDTLGFRMLLGREALRGRFLVDPGRSYLAGRPAREVRRRNRAAS